MNRRYSIAILLLVYTLCNSAAARTWTSKDGKSSVEAELIEIKEGKAFLKKQNGAVVGVPIEKLSDEDQEFLKQQGLPRVSKPAGTEKEVHLSAAAVEEALVSPVSYDFDATPLVDVVAFFATQTKVPFYITPKPFEEIGISTRVAISGKGDKVPLVTALSQLLSPIGLAYVPEQEVILITTQEVSETHLLSQVYQLTQKIDGDELIEEMSSTIEPDMWAQKGGPGSSNVMSIGVLVVSQTDSIHRKIRARYKDLLRPLSPAQKAATSRPGKSTLEDKLNQPTQIDVENKPLNEVVEQLRKEHDVQIVLDEKSVAEVGVPATKPISFHMPEMSLRTALTIMLRELEITWYQERGQLIITTWETEETKASRVSYSLHGLAANENYSEWAEMIENNVQPHLWKNVGGPGSIETTQGGTLEITQSPEVHAEIAKLLSEIRRAKGK